jgi:hypothetical protein
MGFKYIISLSEKETHDTIFSKKDFQYSPNIPVDNGSSFKALIIKLTRQLINITIIDVTMLVV